MKRATTIQHVLEQLDAIIDESIATNSRIGLFAYIYRRTTFEIASEISSGNFEHNERLEILDVEFANMYLDAYRDYKNNQKVSAAWAFAFDHANEPLTITQHILLGMNAHINLDLAVATAKTMDGQDINDIAADFNKVNDILQQITNELQARLSRVSPLLFVIDLIGKDKDEKAINFSMRKARAQAWNSAKLIWSLEETQREGIINKVDTLVLKISKLIIAPNTRIVRFLLQVIQKFETKNVSTIISKLKAN